ncbi:MAG: HAMP domain-containing histidine kinase [Lachnospiraceae bacterium]|nr:HAMP domain-containing histidine kinase [Lachnospiraceae bacterium]
MIKKMQRKFIAITMLSVFLVTCVIAGVINLAIDIRANRQTDLLLSLISDNGGTFPTYEVLNAPTGSDYEMITQETEHSTRYFSFFVQADGTIESSNLAQIITVTEDDLGDILTTIRAAGKTGGYYGQFKYLVTDTDDGTLYVFVDCSSTLSERRSMLIYSACTVVGACFIIFVIVTVCSGKIITPMIENMNRQKEFITNAGHELKTPVAIILANADVLEMKNGPDDEWVGSIRKQANRLDTLIQRLLRMAKMDEMDGANEFFRFSLSDMVRETTDSFQVIQAAHPIEADIAPDVEITGDRESIRELISILLDNATKYVKPEGTVKIQVTASGKYARLDVSNDFESMNREDLNRLFDRFYRSDSSRARKTGGYGIGLSMAQTIVKNHGGKINAEYADGRVHMVVQLKIG